MMPFEKVDRAPQSWLRLSEWRQRGVEPDYRFSLANERTFLAWIRTALSMLAAGIFLDQIAAKASSQRMIFLLSVALSVIATVLSGMAYKRWRDNEIAMRHNQVLPGTLIVPFLAGSIMFVSAVIATAVFFH